MGCMAEEGHLQCSVSGQFMSRELELPELRSQDATASQLRQLAFLHSEFLGSSTFSVLDLDDSLRVSFAAACLEKQWTDSA